MIDTKKGGTFGSVDMSEKAKDAGITAPVAFSESLLKKLRPSQFLVDLGISFDKRLVNLFELVRANLEPAAKGETSGRDFTVPLVVVNGPLVREDILSAVVRVQENSNGEQTILITDLQDADNEYED